MKKIIIALDVNDPEYALDLVDQFSEYVDIFKVGLELFSSGGPAVVKGIHDKGKKVFLDLKFHDIPNTVSQAALAATRMGVFMFNLHASAGFEAMKKTRDAVTGLCLKENLDRPKILAVTVLTSLSQEMLRDEFGIQHSLRTHVKYLAKAAQSAGLDGVIASGHEASLVRKHCGNGFMIVTPGIRASWAPPDDQKRTMTPREAMREGADFLVIGRSVVRQADSIKALDLIQVEILTA
jgi:orotidine-5'-phosphate decarboxylase